jgi:transposase
MDAISRSAAGRRLYTADFKRTQIERIARGEATAAEPSRELGVSRSLIQRWKHLLARRAETAVQANEDVVPASALRAAEQRIRELERALGRKTMEVEILQAAREEVKKKPGWYGVSKPSRAAP